MKTLPLIHIDFILHYITLTNYYNAKNIFKSQVSTAQNKCGNKKKYSKQNENFAFNTHRIYTILYHTYHLLQSKEHVQSISNQSTINVEIKKKLSKQNENFAFNTYRFYTTLYHTYILL